MDLIFHMAERRREKRERQRETVRQRETETKRDRERQRERARSMPEGIDSLAKNISQIYKLGGLKIDVNRILRKITDGEPNIKDTLRNNSAVYYRNCTSKYKKRETDS